ncbi:MAG: amidase [Actinobacteria bacterium]|nr:amidase [Actinomycetota bacterium]
MTATFITELEATGDGPRLAVKDIIDVAGVPTTAGSKVVAEDARPAATDAACMAGARAAKARIVGKANLHELAFGGSGVNPHFGTPVNPIDPGRVPGGSSSGSAVAVANGDADVAYGSDSGGSIRTPAACCGVCGLKTTFGRVPLEGVWPLASSLDTVGPMAATVAGLVLGMQLLEPGFVPADDVPDGVGHVASSADPVISTAIAHALRGAELRVDEVVISGWADAWDAGDKLLVSEAARSNGFLFERLDDLDPLVSTRLVRGASLPHHDVAAAYAVKDDWTATLSAIVERYGVLALPTMAMFPPALEEASGFRFNTWTLPVNVAGLPAVSIPVPTGGRHPASLQLIGARDSEATLLALAARIEAAVGG